MRGHTRRTRRGFSMMEAVVCIALIGVALVAGLAWAGGQGGATVGASARAQTITQRQAIGTMLAAELMAEIMAQAYAEPEGLTILLTEVNDVAGNRSTYDDVDDYDGWSSKPPKDRGNNALSGYTAWRRSVDVDMVRASNLDGDPLILGDSGVKRIVVRVYHGDHLAANQAVDAVAGRVQNGKGECPVPGELTEVCSESNGAI